MHEHPPLLLEELDDSTKLFNITKNALATLALIWFIALWSIFTIGWQTARRRYRWRPSSPLSSASPASVPGVSIIRPLKGLDPNIFENLESSFTQNYPLFEVLLAVADTDDPVLPVVRELCAKYPNVNSRILIGDEIVGVNPKVNNLIRPFALATYDLLWVLDSGIAVDRGTLARSVDALIHPPSSEMRSGKTIGLVHHVPFVITTATMGSRHLGSRLETVFLNTVHAKMYLAINALAIDSCVVGKSNLFRRSQIQCLTGTLRPTRENPGPTGLACFGKFLAEDNMIASALWHELDLRHSLSCDVAHNVIGDMTLAAYIERRIRWIRVRKHMVLAATILEPFTEFCMVTVVTSWALETLLSLKWWLFAPMNLICWLWVDLDVRKSLAGQPLPPDDTIPFFLAWCVRELLAFPIFLYAVCGEVVDWRGVKYRVLRNGEVVKVDSIQTLKWSSNLLPRMFSSLWGSKYDAVATDPNVA